MSAYDEYYRKMFVTERVRAYNEIEEILASYPILLFMKGTPETTTCSSTKVLI